jgi:hypothetical protein
LNINYVEMKNKYKSLFFCIGLFSLWIPGSLSGQDKTGVIYPGATFQNQSRDTLFCLPKKNLERLMDREEISAEIIEGFRRRNAVSDSLLALKAREAENWYDKLMETDRVLEESEILILKEKKKSRRRGRVWFGVGVLVGGVIVGVF